MKVKVEDKHLLVYDNIVAATRSAPPTTPSPFPQGKDSNICAEDADRVPDNKYLDGNNWYGDSKRARAMNVTPGALSDVYGEEKLITSAFAEMTPTLSVRDESPSTGVSLSKWFLQSEFWQSSSSNSCCFYLLQLLPCHLNNQLSFLIRGDTVSDTHVLVDRPEQGSLEP